MRPFQIRVVAICIVLAFVDGFEVLVGAFTATSLAKDFNLDAVQIGYFLSASTFGMAVGAVFISPFADRIGRRKHIIMCLALIVVGMVGSAIAMNYVFLLVARAFAGLWIGALIPSLNILVSEYSSDAKRGTAMGIYGIGLPAGLGRGRLHHDLPHRGLELAGRVLVRSHPHRAAAARQPGLAALSRSTTWSRSARPGPAGVQQDRGPSSATRKRTPCPRRTWPGRRAALSSRRSSKGSWASARHTCGLATAC